MKALTLALALLAVLWTSCRKCPSCPQIPPVPPAPPPVEVVRTLVGCLDAAKLAEPPTVAPEAADLHDHTTRADCASIWAACAEAGPLRAIRDYVRAARQWMAEAEARCRQPPKPEDPQ